MGCARALERSRLLQNVGFSPRVLAKRNTTGIIKKWRRIMTNFFKVRKAVTWRKKNGKGGKMHKSKVRYRIKKVKD